MRFELCRRFGVRVHEVPGLDEEAIFVPEGMVAFIRAGLDPGRRRELAEWLLSEAIAEAASIDRS